MLRFSIDAGVTSRGLEDGGAQELELAKRYREAAQRFADWWPRAASIFRKLSKSYENEARRNEESAERFRLGLERLDGPASPRVSELKLTVAVSACPLLRPRSSTLSSRSECDRKTTSTGGSAALLYTVARAPSPKRRFGGV